MVKFLQYVTDPAHVSELALSSGSMFFVKYEPSPETSLISQKVTAVSNAASFSIEHVQAALGNAFMTEFPAAFRAAAGKLLPLPETGKIRPSPPLTKGSWGITLAIS